MNSAWNRVDLENMEVRLLQAYCYKPRIQSSCVSSGPQCSQNSSSHLCALWFVLGSCGRVSSIQRNSWNGALPEPEYHLSCNWNNPSGHFQPSFPRGLAAVIPKSLANGTEILDSVDHSELYCVTTGNSPWGAKSPPPSLDTSSNLIRRLGSSLWAF